MTDFHRQVSRSAGIHMAWHDPITVRLSPDRIMERECEQLSLSGTEHTMSLLKTNVTFIYLSTEQQVQTPK